MSEALLRVADVAGLLQVSTRTVWRLSDSGEMPKPIRVGGCVRWRQEDLNAWIACKSESLATITKQQNKIPRKKG